MDTMECEFRRVVDAIPGFVWGASANGSIDFVNRRWSEYTGLSLEAACGSGYLSTIHPADVEHWQDYWQSLLGSGESGEMEARLRRSDGTFRWFLIRAVPLHDESGRVTKWYGENVDIEDRKRAEMLLAEEKRLLEMVAGDCSLPQVLHALCEIVEATIAECRCSIHLVDTTGNRIQLQHGAAPSLPASLMAGINGRAVTACCSPCAMAATLNERVVAADIVIETRWPASYRSMVLSHGLRAVWSTPIASTAGKVLGTFALWHARPVTPVSVQLAMIERFTHLASIAIERAQSVEALRRSQAFLAEAQRLSRIGSFSWRVELGEILWSEQVYRLFEIDPAVPLTLDLITSRVHPEDVATLQDMMVKVAAGQDFEYEHRLLMPGGRVKYTHVVAQATRDPQGRLEYIGASHEVTERRRSEEVLGKLRSELAHVARVTSLGALTASIAHELNQPLAGIVTNASTCLRMLATESPNIGGASETARRTIRDANRAADVIARLRALFSNKAATTESMDLNDAAREIISLTLSELQKSHVVLRTKFSDGPLLVMGDRVQLQQVILNLLLNARDAMHDIEDRPRILVIGTEQGQDVVRLGVQDTGVGFEAQAAERLFDAFYTTKSDGMGMGLSVSRTIIESHGGRLSARTNEGPGATFTFSLPVQPAAGESVSGSAPAGHQPNVNA